MPRARALSSYPPAFWEILERVVVKGDVISQTLADHRAAQRLQGKFYAFRQAIKRELQMTEIKPEAYTKAQVEMIQSLMSWANTCVCYFDRATPREEPTVVSFMHRDRTPEAQMLQNMLDSNPSNDPADTDKIAASARRVMARLEEVDSATKPDLVKKYYDR
jgi:hypothetical protein